MKILNLYCGIGGNRKLWGEEHEITAVENNKDIAKIYQDFYPNDKVIIGDAHKYLLEHFKEFDFIWSSPPCPTHSRIRKVGCVVGGRGQEPHKPKFPDMKLYEEILLLKGYFKGKWVVENVISWYEPLIRPYKYKEHYYWSNFVITGTKREGRSHNDGNKILAEVKGFDLSPYKNIDKRAILRNCVEPEAAQEIFNMAFKNQQVTLF